MNIFPDIDQLLLTKRREGNYLLSLWYGLTAPIANVWIILWNCLCVPLIAITFRLVITLFTVFVLIPLAGLFGRVMVR